PFAIGYAIDYLIRKGKDKDKKFSKKGFYWALIGELILVIFGTSFAEPGSDVLAERDAAVEENEQLTTDNETLQAENDELAQQVADLESELEEVSEEKATFDEDMDSLTEEISELE